jgi:hypothetical protein
MDSISGLPAHPLLVHIVVIILPLTGAAAILGRLWPRAQRKFTFLTPLGALVGLIAVPITISAGQSLASTLPEIRPVLAQHITHASRVLPLTIALFVLTTAQWAYLQFGRKPPKRWLTVVLAVLVVAVSVATVAQVVLTGDAGSRAVWG